MVLLLELYLTYILSVTKHNHVLRARFEESVANPWKVPVCILFNQDYTEQDSLHPVFYIGLLLFCKR